MGNMYFQDIGSSNLVDSRGRESCQSSTMRISWLIACFQPAVSILHTIYAIFHLCRPAKARTPGSSASYMLFAAVVDAAVIPFYVLTAIMSKVQHRDKTYGWDTLFETPVAADKIIFSAFLGCSVVGGLHLAGLVIDLYLAIIFRKIAKLPPDMNPLEDNLTTRPHKRSRSELAEKHLSGSTAVSSNRGSLAQDPLIIPTRQVPFMHTRENSGVSLQSPRNIDDEQSSYYSCQSKRYSRSDLPSQVFRQHEQSSQPRAAIARAHAQKRGTASRPQSAVINDAPRLDVPQPESAEIHLRDASGVSSLTTMDNWITYGSEPPSPTSRASDETVRDASPLDSRLGSPDDNLVYGTVERDLGRLGNAQSAYAPLQLSFETENVYDKEHTENLYSGELDIADKRHSLFEEEHPAEKTRFLMNPLEMNPPTPRPLETNKTGSWRSRTSSPRVPLADLPNPSISSGRSTPVKGPNGSKTQSYRELHQSPSGPHDDDNGNSATPSKNTKTRWRRKSGKFTAYESLKVDADDSDGEGPKAVTPGETDRKGRVVSNTGIDLGNGLGSTTPGYSSYIAGLGVGRRRDVSGKVAEEGRAGPIQAVTETPTKPNRPRRLSKTGETKAAGWARWRGL